MAALMGREVRNPPEPASEIPEDVSYLWSWYLELSMGVEQGMAGGFLTWTVLDAWARHMGVSPEPRECMALFSLDRSYRNPEPEKKT